MPTTPTPTPAPTPTPDLVVEPPPDDVEPPPLADDGSGLGVGLASVYSNRLSGRRTASGERYRPKLFTCAHRTLPFGTVLLVEDTSTGVTVRCRVNDRGPHVDGRIVDLSRKAARQLGIVDRGIAEVRISIAPDEPTTP